MRLLFTGPAPWCTSAYAKIIRNILPRLSRLGHDVGLACFYGLRGAIQCTEFSGEPVTIYPTARDPWLNDIIEYHAQAFEADLVISIHDVPQLTKWGERGFTWLPWLPIDTQPVTAEIVHALRGCYMPLVYSQWGQRKLIEAGWESAQYMPLGVDLDVFKPMGKTEARRIVGLPEEGFVVGMVAANSSYPSRKSFPEVLQAWKQWTDGGGEGVLYLHTTVLPRFVKGVNFPLMLETLDLDWTDLSNAERQEESVIFAKQYLMRMGGYTDADMATIYNCFDVLMAPSQGEGFGMPILEAQACGVPVITTDFSAMSELMFAGQLIKSDNRSWDNRGGWRCLVSPLHILMALQTFRRMQPDAIRSTVEERAIHFSQPFAWDHLIETYWQPLLAEVA